MASKKKKSQQTNSLRPLEASDINSTATYTPNLEDLYYTIEGKQAKVDLQLVDAKKLLVAISDFVATGANPTSISKNGLITNLYDPDLTNYVVFGISSGTSLSADATLYFDFGKKRDLRGMYWIGKYNSTLVPAAPTQYLKIYISDDANTWREVYSLSETTRTGADVFFEYISGNITFRFLKVVMNCYRDGTGASVGWTLYNFESFI